MKMDEGREAENSPPPLPDGGESWGVGSWETEGEAASLLSGINAADTRGLHSLVEDKEIAARAVAFVVNSTRKGIVPLCSDVAALLRSKRSLELKVARLRNENQILHCSLTGSIRTSHSGSPTRVSVTSLSDRGLPLDHRASGMRHSKCSPSCSRSSSQCSSIISNSPKLEKHGGPRSPRLRRTSAFSVPRTQALDTLQHQVTQAMVHNPAAAAPAPPSGSQMTSPRVTDGSRAASFCEHSSPPGGSSADSGIGLHQRPPRLKNHERKNSLPEMTCEPHGNLPKISPRAKRVSREVQCALDEGQILSVCPDKMDERFKDSLQVTAGLAEELSAAKQEIEILRDRIRELEMKQLAKQVLQLADQFHIENESAPNRCHCPATTLPGQPPHHVGPAPDAPPSGSDSPDAILPSSRETNIAMKKRRPCRSVSGTVSKHTTQPQPSAGASTPSATATPSAATPTAATSPEAAVVARGRPFLAPFPLQGCCCQACEAAIVGGGDRSTAKSVSARPSTASALAQSPKFNINLGDHVVVDGQKTGRVRYVGHLDDHVAPRHVVFIGLELDAPVGSHEGVYNGKRYFSCEKRCGLFVQMHEVLCIINKQIHTGHGAAQTAAQTAACAPSTHGAKQSTSQGRSLHKNAFDKVKDKLRDKAKEKAKDRRYPTEPGQLQLLKNSVLTQLV